MRLGSVMLVLALLTTCAISATFAKYVTSATGNDSARVAYWGWNSSGNLAGSSTDLALFKTSYAADDETATSENTVVSSNDKERVIAPGTTNSVDVAFKYTGYANTSDAANAITAPEVAYNFAVTAKATGNDGTSAVDVDALDANPNFFWTLQKDDGTVKSYSALKDLMAAIASLSGTAATAPSYSTSGATTVTSTTEYAAGALPSDFATVGSDKAITNATYTIGWNWYFDKSSTAVTVDPAVNPSDTDTGDTYMGNGLGYDGKTTPANLDDLKLEITITATQID